MSGFAADARRTARAVRKAGGVRYPDPWPNEGRFAPPTACQRCRPDMITRLEIDGFRSVEKFAVDLAPFTVIVGNNAAGKSNLFDAVQLLARLATHDVAEAMKGLRGEPLELFRRTSSGRVSRIGPSAFSGHARPSK